MKKFLVILFALLLPTSLMATSFIQIGPILNYSGTAANIVETDPDDLSDLIFNIENYGLGAEVRINPIRYLSIAAPLSFHFSSNSFGIDAAPSVNLNVPLTGLFDLAAGVGMNLYFRNADGWTINGKDMSSFVDVLKNSNLFYRAAFTVNLAFVSVGLSAMVPTEDSFSNFSFSPDWEATSFSVSLLFNFF